MTCRGPFQLERFYDSVNYFCAPKGGILSAYLMATSQSLDCCHQNGW